MHDTSQATIPDPWLERLGEEEWPEVQPLPIPEAIMGLDKLVDEMNRKILEAFGVRRSWLTNEPHE